MSDPSSFYLGREVDPKTHALGARVDLDARDLLTHGLIVGMTGSGKTGLGIVMIEEALRHGIPVIAIDPKGDLTNLMLLFDDLAPSAFAAWVDREGAQRRGQTVDAAGAEAAAKWREGLSQWGLSAVDVAALRAGHEAVLYTPGSTSGTPLDILQSFAAPKVPFDSAAEDLRGEISGLVSGLLGLVGIEADPLQSREAILLSTIVEAAWRAGKGHTLESLIATVADPPFDKLGALPLETFFPARDRQALMLSLNALAASPSFEAWRQGEPLDVDRMLRAADGRPRLSIVYTAHLSDAERLFVTALLLDKIKTWMRSQSGTGELRALVYMDEIFGYFPPHPANPPTKRPLLTLVKQARAQGVGIVLATQNPVDLDYKALANLGAWMIGKLQTERDRDRLRDGLSGSGADMRSIDALLDAAAPRVFLLHDVHRAKPVLLHSRWTMSYLRGPLTRTEIANLRGQTPATTVTTPKTAAAQAPPVLPEPLDHLYFSRYGGELADPHLFIKYALRVKGQPETVAARAYPLQGSEVTELLEGEPLPIEEAKLATATPASIRYGDLPAFVIAAGPKAIERILKERLPDKLAFVVFDDPASGTASAPGETKDAFLARLEQATGGPAADKLRDRLDKKRHDLAAREQELSGRKTEKWAAIGGALLSNIGLFTGRKRTISGASSVLTKNRMENTTEARVEALRTEIAQLEADLATATTVDASRLTEKTVVPARGDVKILRYDIVWIY